MFIVTPLQAFSFEKAIVLDGTTGDVLFEHHAYEKSQVASLTKIMTAVVALDHTGDFKYIRLSALSNHINRLTLSISF
jgi:D-alanyl-D-alanine carboxypeptidase